MFGNTEHLSLISYFSIPFTMLMAHLLDCCVNIFPKFTSGNEWLDCQFSTYGSLNEPVVVVSLGHKFMLSFFYGMSPIEDYELAKMLVRPLPVFVSTLAKAEKFSEGRYGSVRQVSVICKEDKSLPEGFIREMIEGNGVKEVKEIEGADHMGMLSKPHELYDCLVQILAVENP